ncbi:2-octaprenyl-6-methoxyphenyl hydroxylase [Aestuariibacter salexigens]|uniref:2-octaprenyl-6-methoxyphenyl hydroxylase n=1 Tax=Aestuariibacter salexigens TaxID=226010 RepID=UPI0006889F49|nr:2-octaprenyl-6-methoxyphenyl hydroxylase [Aestuariibacter salexigens]
MLDIVIVGAGPVGASLALGLLQHTDLTVALVEAHSPPDNKPPPSFDNRAVALNAASLQLLQSLGLALAGASIKHIQVTDAGHMGEVQLHSDEYQLRALGKVVELTELGHVLHGALREADTHCERFTRVHPASVKHCRVEQQSVEVVLGNDEILHTKLVVHAQGSAHIDDVFGVPAEVTDYQQTAIIANVDMSQPHAGWAYERFTENGPLALLPMCEQHGTNRMSLVWTVSTQQANTLLNDSDAVFMQKLQRALGFRQGIVRHVGKRDAYPLSLKQLQSVIAHRQIAMGNAAQTLHPIAGQGLNLGLRDVAALISVLSNQHDCGAHRVLAHYRDARMTDRQRVIGLTDGLVRMFSNNALPLTVGRNLGLLGMELLPFLKKRFAYQAMGLNGAMLSGGKRA